MVANPSDAGAATADAVHNAVRSAVRACLYRRAYRFLSVDCHGRFTVRLDRLAELVTEIVAEQVAEQTTGLRAELDAANDSVCELIGLLEWVVP